MNHFKLFYNECKSDEAHEKSNWFDFCAINFQWLSHCDIFVFRMIIIESCFIKYSFHNGKFIARLEKWPKETTKKTPDFIWSRKTYWSFSSWLSCSKIFIFHRNRLIFVGKNSYLCVYSVIVEFSWIIMLN